MRGSEKRRPASTALIGLGDFEELARAGLQTDEIFGTPRRRVAKLAMEGDVTSSAEDRAVNFVISTGALDRYNSTINPNGWRLDNYRKNPVVLFGHDDSSPPIARATNTRVENGKLKSTAIFADRDTFPLADTIFRLVKGKFLNAASVGWIPLEWEFVDEGQGEFRVAYKAQELWEFSVVSIPANPDCLVEARSIGINTKPLVDWSERALDEGKATMHATRLEHLRKAAGARSLYPARAAGNATSLARDGFNSLGEHLQAIARACAPSGLGERDRRLVRAPDLDMQVRLPTGAGEVDPSQGGFLVGTQWARELVGFAYEEAVLAPLCDRRETSGPLADVKVPAIDETSRADGSRWGGALSYWLSEASTITTTFPRFKLLNFSARKLLVAISITNELLEDAPMLDAHIRRVFGAELGFKLDLALLLGTGVGTPLGVVNAPAAITVAKETGQSPQTIIAENVRKMWSRLPGPSRKRAVWLVNEDAEEQLEQMVNVVGAAGAEAPTAAALYMPAGANGNEYPLLKGRPVLTMEQSSVLGTPGDIVLADPSHYVLIDGGVTPLLSVHVQFLDDSSVWRFSYRVDGRPAFSSPITPYNGSSNTRSPFVVLGAR